MRFNVTRRWLSVLLVLAVAGVVSAAFIFEQIQPTVPLSGTMTANCNPTAPTPASVDLGTSGQMTFSCSSGNPTANPAFTTTARVVVKPTITGLAAPYNTSRLYIYNADGTPNTGPCGLRADGERIANGETETLQAEGWNYCAEYENVDRELPQFKVSWST